MVKLFLGSALIAVTLGGCFVDGNARVVAPVPTATVEVEVDEEPPAPQVYVASVRPGFIYIDGRYERRGGRWVWREGYYERERSGYLWEPGHWERGHHGHVYREGHWRRR